MNAVIEMEQLHTAVVHEAGHAALASRLAIAVMQVRIAGDGVRCDGFTHANVARAGLVDWVATLMAGRIAERTILGYEAT
jgi:ATP-dependent Zn protease